MAPSVHDKISDFRDDTLGREINKEATLDSYATWIRRFEVWRPGDPPTESTLRDFDSYLHDEAMSDYPWTNPRGRGPPASYDYKTRIKAISALKKWYEYEYERVEKEVQNIVKGEPEEFDPTVLGQSEIKDTIGAAQVMCDNDGCHAAVSVGYDAIMRGSELVQVKREDVDFDDGTVFVRATKGSNQTTVSLSESTLNVLRQYMSTHADCDPIFTNSHDNPWSPDAWSQHFRRAHHDAGWHSVGRHSAICNRLNRGEPFGEVFRRSRHQNVSTFLRYGKIVDMESPGWAEEL